MFLLIIAQFSMEKTDLIDPFPKALMSKWIPVLGLCKGPCCLRFCFVFILKLDELTL